MANYVNGEGPDLVALFESQNQRIEEVQQTIQLGNNQLAKALDSHADKIVAELREQRKTLIVPATNRNTVGMGVITLLFGGMFIFMFISSLGANGKSMHLDSKGLHIEEDK